MDSSVRRLLLIAAPLTFFVIVAGAFTRLSDAGLGCPDWPTCYGQLVGVPDAETAAAHSPDSPLDTRKAWIEVGHRYVAALLGLLLLAAAALSLRQRPIPKAPILLLILAILQGLLGMLTVTDLLRPIVVSAHLMGGALIFASLAFAIVSRAPTQKSSVGLRILCVFAIATLSIQIFLGGWVSTNYAALSCPAFPKCANDWLPNPTDWSGFVLSRDLHMDSAGAPITAAALATIHWTHRTFAVIVLIVLAVFAKQLWKENMRGPACAIGFLLVVQTVLGIINVASGLPLWSALAHNAVAALLAAKMGVATAMVFRTTPHPAAT